MLILVNSGSSCQFNLLIKANFENESIFLVSVAYLIIIMTY